MKIGFCGSNSTGKTTLLNELKKEPQFKGYDFLDEITRNVSKKAPINEDGNDLTQLLILNTHLSNVYDHENFFADRSILDGLVYTEWLYEQGKVSGWIYEYAIHLLQKIISEYDYIFYLPIEIPLEDDGVRSSDPVFRASIDRAFQFWIKELEKGEDCCKIITLTGSVDERIGKLKQIAFQ